MRKSDLVFREATSEDLHKFYGGPPPATMVALVALLDDEPIAVAGVLFLKEARVGFSEMKPAMRPRKKDIVRFALVAIELVKRYNHVVVFANPNEPHSNALLTRLGLTYQGPNEQGEMYTWQLPYRTPQQQ